MKYLLGFAFGALLACYLTAWGISHLEAQQPSPPAQRLLTPEKACVEIFCKFATYPEIGLEMMEWCRKELGEP